MKDGSDGSVSRVILRILWGKRKKEKNPEMTSGGRCVVALDDWTALSHIEFDHHKSRSGLFDSFTTAERFLVS